MSGFPEAKRFMKGEWEALQEIILFAEGGKFREILHSRNAATNMLKADVWTTINRMFNEVCFSL